MADATGTNLLQKATLVLRVIARRGGDGLTLKEIVKLSALPHATTYRILQGLIVCELVCRSGIGHRYVLGPLNYELGMATPIKFSAPDDLQAALRDIAAVTGEHTYLMRRSGLEYICVALQEGQRQLGSVTMAIGDRRSLVLGAPGHAMLAVMDPLDVERIIAHYNAEITAHRRLTHDILYRQIAHCKKHGYTLGRDVTVVGIGSVSVPLIVPISGQISSVCLGVPSRFLTQTRIAELRGLLFEHLAPWTGPAPA